MLRAAGVWRRRGVQRIAEMPRLPVVALDEVEPRRVRREPCVRAGRPEIELGRVAMQRRPGRRDPLRIGMGGEQRGLLGVGAERAGDQERDAVLACRALETIERLRDVRTHRLALAVGERAVIAAALGVGVDARGRQLRLGHHADRDPPPLGVALDLHDFPDADADPHRRDRVRVGEPDRHGVGAVGVTDPLGRLLRCGEVCLAGDVPRVGNTADHRRLEQPRVRLVHGARPGERGEIRGPLSAGLARHPTRHRAEDQHADEHRGKPAHEQHRRLAARLLHHAISGVSRGETRGAARPASASVRARPLGSGGTATAGTPRAVSAASAARASVLSGSATTTATSCSAISVSQLRGPRAGEGGDERAGDERRRAPDRAGGGKGIVGQRQPREATAGARRELAGADARGEPRGGTGRHAAARRIASPERDERGGRRVRRAKGQRDPGSRRCNHLRRSDHDRAGRGRIARRGARSAAGATKNSAVRSSHPPGGRPEMTTGRSASWGGRPVRAHDRVGRRHGARGRGGRPVRAETTGSVGVMGRSPGRRRPWRCRSGGARGQRRGGRGECAP